MSQKAIVKTASVKEGDNAKGHWINTLITTSDGSKLGTFEHSAKDLIEGDEFEYEPEVKGDRVNIKSGSLKILKRAAATPEGSSSPKETTNGGSRVVMTPKDWSEKDRLERLSIETSTAFKGVIDLAVAHIVAGKEIGDHLSIVLKKGLGWAGAHFDATNPVEPSPGKPVNQDHRTEADTDWDKMGAERVTIPASAFSNAGELFTALQKRGISRAQALNTLGLNDKSDLSKLNLIDAFATVIGANK